MFPKPCSFVPEPEPLSSGAETFTNSCVSEFLHQLLIEPPFICIHSMEIYLKDAERNFFSVSLSVKSRR